MLIHSAAASAVGTLTSIQPPVQTGLYGYWDASIQASYPGSGTTWTDLTGNFNGATVRGAVSFVGDSNSSYFDIPGGSSVYTDRSIISLGNDWAPAGEVHCSAWIYKDAWGTQQQNHVFSLVNGLTAVDILFENYDDRLIFALKAGGSFYSAATPSGLPSGSYLNQWTYLSLNYNGSTLTGYRNGVNIVTVTGVTGNTDNYTGIDTGLGGQGWTLDGGVRQMRNILQGRLAVVQLHRAALTEDEILQNYNSMKGRFGL